MKEWGEGKGVRHRGGMQHLELRRLVASSLDTAKLAVTYLFISSYIYGEPEGVGFKYYSQTMTLFCTVTESSMKKGTLESSLRLRKSIERRTDMF